MTGKRWAKEIISRRRKAGDRVLGCIKSVGSAKQLGSAWLDSGKIHLPFSLFAILTKSDFFFQHAFFDSPNGTADPGCQTETAPERGKIHLPLGFFENFKDVLAAQVPPGSIVTSVACGPDCPRLKDCPGLGDPNTLKSYNLND